LLQVFSTKRVEVRGKEKKKPICKCPKKSQVLFRKEALKYSKIGGRRAAGGKQREIRSLKKWKSSKQ